MRAVSDHGFDALRSPPVRVKFTQGEYRYCGNLQGAPELSGGSFLFAGIPFTAFRCGEELRPVTRNSPLSVFEACLALANLLCQVVFDAVFAFEVPLRQGDAARPH